MRIFRIYIFLLLSRMHTWSFVRIILAWHVLRLKKIFKADFTIPKDNSSHTTVDLVFPTIAKDFAVLKTTIQSAQKHLTHKVNKIFIVSQDSTEIVDFCRENNYTFIHERSVLGYGKEAIDYAVNGKDRSGWMFQQLLKLSGDTFIEKENYIIIDTDTVLINSHSFIYKDSFVFYQNEEWHQPYFNAFEFLFGYQTKNSLSYTSHMMIFNKTLLKEMKCELEKRHGLAWDKAYIKTADPNEESCVSDYDTYANWVLCHYPEKVIDIPLYNRSLSRSLFAPIEELEQSYGKKYNTLSFHSYIK